MSDSDFVIKASPGSSLMLLLSLTITVWGSSSERKSYVYYIADYSQCVWGGGLKIQAPQTFSGSF